jgi:CRISPR-associated endonuclease/helicase Cas3
MSIAYAHSGTQSDRSDWQTLSSHLAQTASLAAERASPFALTEASRLAAAFHDFGKNDPAFDRVLQGKGDRVDHSTAGGRLLIDRADSKTRFAAQLLAHTILGHHAGLPDSTGSEASQSRRLDGFNDPISVEVTRAAVVDLLPAARELAAKCRKEHLGFDLSLAGRMVFSALVDADFRDTEAFYGQMESGEHVWPGLQDILPGLRSGFDRKMAGFASGELNQLRSEILRHIRVGADLRPGLFTLTVPTGGGKTLASMGFALDHAARYGHRRIIYAIPYTSIIDQTAETFRNLFQNLGDVVLEHHSAIDTEASTGPKIVREGSTRLSEQKAKLRLAMEDWAAPIVVTTNVQLFESLFGSRPSRCRKLHNIAGSVIILDEAQCLPRSLLAPTLRMIDALAAHYGCTVVLCTATQPAFNSAQLDRSRRGNDGKPRKIGLDLTGRELAPGPDALAERLRRARIVDGGTMDDAALTVALQETPQAMVIVNSRKHALALYRAVEDQPGALHLTTRQYPAHRRQIIADIKRRLAEDAPCRLIATSLIEAGVDLSFPKGWRAEAGLDSIVQAAGRVNREGRWDIQTSTLTVFTPTDHAPPAEIQTLAKTMRSTLARFGPDALLSPAAIRHWFEEVYWRAGESLLDRHAIVEAFRFAPLTGDFDFAYRSVAESYRMVESPLLPVIIPTEASTEAIRQLGVEQISSSRIARALQPYVVQVPARSREMLRINGKGSFVSAEIRGDQFFVLSDPGLYRQNIGLFWEGADELSETQAMI